MTDINHKSIMAMGRYRGLSIAEIEPQLLKDMYRFMLRLRRCQEEIANRYHPADQMRCPVHFCIGEEAMPAALSFLISRDDYLFSHHRSHGYYLAKGGAMTGLIAELHGRETGTNGGMAGSQEISSPDLNFYSVAIISGMLATAVGAGLGLTLKKRNQIAFAVFGDAATEEGVFWESINYAALKRLPVVFICENNGYSTYSPQRKRQPEIEIHSRVKSFGIRTHALFGNDVAAAYSLMKDAIDRVHSGEGPVFLELYTYRWKGHVGPEDDDYIGYRPSHELEFWKNNCPILLLEEQMFSSGLMTENYKRNILNDINAELSKAFDYAQRSPFPVEPADWRGVNYSNSTPVADEVLRDLERSNVFNPNQEDALPGPY
jgi:pyruvate dehydrogenase E1 component alpha subunit